MGVIIVACVYFYKGWWILVVGSVKGSFYGFGGREWLFPWTDYVVGVVWIEFFSELERLAVSRSQKICAWGVGRG